MPNSDKGVMPISGNGVMPNSVKGGMSNSGTGGMSNSGKGGMSNSGKGFVQEPMYFKRQTPAPEKVSIRSKWHHQESTLHKWTPNL